MLPLLDAVALSAWSRAMPARGSSRNHLPFDEASFTTDPGAPETLESVLEALGAVDVTAVAGRLRERAATWLDQASRSGMEPIVLGGSGYPAQLGTIGSPPLVLWLKGNAAALRGPSVAVVGSRAASATSLEAAMHLAADLSAAGATVVSGLARGIDSAAHRGVLKVAGVTVAVLGSGLDVVYPPEHRGLADAITDRGAVVSEYPPGTPPLPGFFPARNRIISGLSLGVVVVEAAKASGSLITATFALEQGRPVMAVPGDTLSGRYRGSHALLRDGAALVESAEDVLAELQWNRCRHGGAAAAESDAVLEAMASGEAYDVDSLAGRTGLQPPSLLPRLLELELRGAVLRLPGGRFLRPARTC
jgi:DNA processing protein